MPDNPLVYIPIDRRFALARGQELPERARGAALFADISGFTVLTELLARRLGPQRGAEELTVYLNRVYDALIGEVHRYGGSVIGFSGDAITCWYAGDDGHRATATALAMQAAVGQFQDLQVVGGGSVSLAMKAAVVTGSVRRFVVGDPGYTLVDVMAGATLERLAAAEHLAEKGEVILDAAAVASLGSRVAADEWRLDESGGGRFARARALAVPAPEQPWPELPEGSVPPEQARAWLPPRVYERLQTGGGEFLAELRPGVALFLRFTGLDYEGDEDAPGKLNAFIRLVESVLAQYDGSLIQLTIGDKGSYLYAAFGAPVAHEDDAARAAYAALALQDAPAKLGYLEPLQIGITYGRMRVGAYGSALRRTYGVLGDDVNLAARLMQAARPGEILVSEAAHGRIQGPFVWEDLPPIRVKGKSEPVALRRLVRLRRRREVISLERRFPEPPIGRQAQTAQFDERLAGLLGGRGGTVRLAGEAGMGKSHLAAHLSRRAADRGVRVVLGAGQSLTQNTLYAPWRQILAALLDIERLREAEALAHVTGYFDTRHPDWNLRLPLLGDVLGLPVPDNPTTQAMDSDVRQRALFTLVGELLQAFAAGQPLLVVLDNAQWIDEASRTLTAHLAHLFDGRPGVLLLVIHRREMLGERGLLPELDELPHTLALPLAEMTPAEAAELVALRLGSPPSPLLGEVTAIMGRGNPFFTGELAGSMRQAGQIFQRPDGRWDVAPELLGVLQRAGFVVQAEGEWRLKPGMDLFTLALGVPDSVHKLVLARLDNLPEAHKLTLKVSSVIGHLFPLPMVARVYPEPKGLPALESEADYMTGEGVIRRTSEEARREYAFRHHSMQEVAYDTLLFTQRQQLHREVARALHAEEPGAVTQIAHHAFLGQVWDLALEYNLQAGAQAKQLHANQQSLDFYQKALQSAEALDEEKTRPSRKQVHLALGELLVSMGQYEQAEGHLHTARALAQALGDPEADASGCRWLGRSREMRGQFAEALEWLEQGFAALDGQPSPEQAELTLVAGLINVRRGNFAEAWALCERGLETARKLGDATIEARACSLMGIIELRSEGDKAIELFSQALGLYEQAGNLYGQANSHNLIANGFFAMGALSRADYHYRQALDMFTQIGHLYSQVLVNNNLGGIALKQGRLDDSLGYYQRAARQLEQIGGSLWVFGALHMNIAHAHLRRGELEQAAGQLARAQDEFERAQARDLLPELYGLFAELALLQGDRGAAEAHGGRGVELARELKMPREEGHNLRVLGEIALAGGRFDEAGALFEQSQAVLAAANDEFESARALLSLARLHTARGEREPARAALEACRPVFERLEARLDLEAAREVEGQLAEGKEI